MRQLALNILKDETGGEVMETALVLGLLVIGAIGLISALGIKFVQKWQALADAL